MTRRTKRLAVTLASLGALAGAAALVLAALGDSVTFFFSPSELAARAVEPGRRLRVGGLVEQGSIRRGEGALVHFVVTDGARMLAVEHRGILPDLFREGQGVVAEGALREDGVFLADTVLARHDETYMPPEVADALKRAGHWREPGGRGPAAPPEAP